MRFLTKFTILASVIALIPMLVVTCRLFQSFSYQEMKSQRNTNSDLTFNGFEIELNARKEQHFPKAIRKKEILRFQTLLSPVLLISKNCDLYTRLTVEDCKNRSEKSTKIQDLLQKTKSPDLSYRRISAFVIPKKELN